MDPAKLASLQSQISASPLLQALFTGGTPFQQTQQMMQTIAAAWPDLVATVNFVKDALSEGPGLTSDAVQKAARAATAAWDFADNVFTKLKGIDRAASAGDLAIGGNTTDGVKIGNSGNKLAFYGATTIVQPSAAGSTTLTSAGTGTALKNDSTTTGGAGTTAYTVSDIVKHLKDLNLIAQ